MKRPVAGGPAAVSAGSAGESSGGPALSGRDIAARFRQLTAYLKRFRGVWEPRPFCTPRLPWESDYPDAAAWLRDSAPEGIEYLDGTPLPSHAPDSLLRWEAEGRALTACPRLPAIASPLPETAFDPETPERKRAQLTGFLSALPVDLRGVSCLVEWCAGKGHLGRLAGKAHGLPVTTLERQPHLCETAERLAAAAGVRLTAVVADVLTPGIARHIPHDAAMMGLHACGILSSAFVRACVTGGVRVLALVPCCHHYRNKAESYEPLSRLAAEAEFPLTSGNLRLSVLGEHFTTDAARGFRRREESFRLGFDALMRGASGSDEYISPGGMSRTVVRLEFREFCAAAAARLGVEIPAGTDFGAYEATGSTRAREARCLSVARGLFRRPLELWVVLDHALYLADHGYDVSVGTFCDEKATPRNLMILGRKAAE